MSTPKVPRTGAFRVKKVQAKDLRSQQHQDALEDLASQLNARFAPDGTLAAWAASLPIGIPQPLPKHLYPPSFKLPANVVECDGRKINDARSILNGATLDDLNGGGYFIRGGATAGTVQSDSVKDHTHPITDPGHRHTYASDESGTTGLHKAVTINPTSVSTDIEPVSTETTGITATDAGGGGTETRPKNVSHVYVIRLF